MYNRYTPNTQGGFRRQTVPQERPREEKKAPAAPEPPRAGSRAQEPPARREAPPRGAAAPVSREPAAPPQPAGTLQGNPLAGLLSGFDRGDTLVLLILLLLLMEGNEDSTTVVMTLAIYLMLQ